MENKEKPTSITENDEDIIDDSEYANPETLEEAKKFSDLNDGEQDEVILQTSTGQNVDYSIAYIDEKSWESFKIDKELNENLISKGFKKPSKIQSNVLSVFFGEQMGDIIGQSQNGSGKTLSFLVPSLNTLDKSYVNSGKDLAPQVIILADTKELTYQITKIACLLKQEWAIIDHLHQERNEAENLNVHLLVTTLGTLFFMIKKKKLSLRALKFLVIDEADKIVSSDSNRSKLPSLFKSLSKEARIGLFSATLPDKCVSILDTLKRQYVKIVVERKTDLSLKNLNHYYVRCDRNKKLEFIDKFMSKMTKGSVIMFVNSKKFAENFARRLYQKNHKTEILVGDMDIKDRLQILDKFKQGSIRILISTNLIARGIDARKVSLVINLDLPYEYNPNAKKGEDFRLNLDMETYLHRTGRTARFGDKGIALNVVEDERNLKDIKQLEEVYGITLTEITVDNFENIINENLAVNTFNAKKREENEEEI